ncbi:MAG TPA: nucleotidyltransferase domain-containing protein [Planctomycetota bacterium]|nr:nucleotidyltransferase domain-containing protein [Planctomycetota bacterium]
MKRVDETTLKEIVRRLVAEFSPEAVILFGSHAWGTPGEDSDLDLLVIVSESDEIATARATRGHLAVGEIMVPMDILVKTREEVERYRPVYASLTRRIMDEGKVLYGRRETRVGA